jgi:putative ubiquitin-RnfH superfamily antitoxin RatB of RatAB toxin-antitoxin module
MANKVHVEVAYATPESQVIVPVTVDEGATLYDAVVRSGISERFPEIDPESVSMGVFGKAVRKPKEQALNEGERVEIYRPLKIDPKTARANRAAKAKAKKALDA